jgi:hypothetical protein
MYELFNKARKDGLMGMESDVEEPSKSRSFPSIRNFERPPRARFRLRHAANGHHGSGSHSIWINSWILTMEVHHHDSGQPIAALSSMADSLPGLGIVAAVLGVVITMGAWEGLRKRLGRKWPRHWWVRFSAFCSATGSWARSRRIWPRPPRMKGLPARSSCGDDYFPERDGADHGRGGRPPRHSRTCSSFISGS